MADDQTPSPPGPTGGQPGTGNGRPPPPPPSPPAWGTPPPPPAWGTPAQPAGYAAPPPGPAYGGPAKTEGLAIGALVCAIIGLFICGIVLGVVALALAANAQKRIDASGGLLTGSGLVTAARIIGVIAIVAGAVLFAVVLSSR
jgi:hypothetical protein